MRGLVATADNALLAISPGGRLIVARVAVIAATVFWIYCLFEVIRRIESPGRRVGWFLIVFFLWVIGGVIFLLFEARAQKGGGDSSPSGVRRG